MEKLKHKNKYSNLRWIWNELKGNKLRLILVSVVVIISAFSNLLIAYVLKFFTDVATKQSQLLISQVVLIAFIILLSAGVSGILYSVISRKIQGKTEVRIRKKVMSRVLNGDYIKVQNIHSGDFLTKLTEDVADISSLFPMVLTQLIGNLIIAILALVSLFLLNIKIAVAMTVSMPLLIAILSLFNGPIEKADKARKEAEESNRILMQEYISKTKTIKIYNMENRFLQLFEKNYGKVYHNKLRFGLWDGVANFLNNLIGNAMLLITLGLGAYYVLEGETTVGTLIAIIQLLNYIINPFNKIASSFSKIAQANTSVDRIKDILSIGSDSIEERNPLQKENRIEKNRNRSNIKKEGFNKHKKQNKNKEDRRSLCINEKSDFDLLRIENLSFSYGEKQIFENMNLTFKKNFIYYLRGENGSGKSTLLNILTGLYKMDKGTISLLNKEGTFISSEVSSFVSLLPANETLFKGTVMENITLFSENIDESKIKEIEAVTSLENVIGKLEKGYDTEILENGKSLSSGQGQQISLSRALYHKTEILLFDESTSNLDKEALEHFKEMLAKLKGNRIIIIVSHDEKMMECADYCYEIGSKDFIELGPIAI